MDIALVILIFGVVVIALIWITNIKGERQAKRIEKEKAREQALQKASLEEARLVKKRELHEDQRFLGGKRLSTLRIRMDQSLASAVAFAQRKPMVPIPGG